MRKDKVWLDRSSTVIEVRIKEPSKTILFKSQCNIADQKAVRRLFDSLKHYGINLEQIMKLPAEEDEFEKEMRRRLFGEEFRKKQEIWW